MFIIYQPNLHNGTLKLTDTVHMGHCLGCEATEVLRFFLSMNSRCSAQFGPRPDRLHDICHSSLLQLTQDQVIENVNKLFDNDNDGDVDDKSS